MIISEVLFWTASLLVLYAYLGYPLLIRNAGSWLLKRPRPVEPQVGGTILLISAYNEEGVIGAKLDNAVDLAPEDMRIVVVSDGSTDGTDDIVREAARANPRIELVRIEGRCGKNHALNEALSHLHPEPDTVIVFTDANATFASDAIELLRTRLQEGAVCAVGRLEFTEAVTGTARAEGLYWRYENWLKRREGRLGRLPIANGAIFAARARDIPHLPSEVGNDFWIPIVALGSGRPVVYEPRAVASEPAPAEDAEEFGRKLRMGNRQMRGVIECWKHLDRTTRFQLVSHKVLRWLGIPLLAVVGGTGLLLWDQHLVYRVAAGGLLLSLLLAAIGATAHRLGRRIPVASLAAHFFLVHLAALIGLAEALVGRTRSTWEAAPSTRRIA